MLNTQPNQRTQSSERASFGEIMHAQYKDIQGRIDRVEKELDRVNVRMDRLESRMDKIDTRLEKLADKIDDLHKEIKSSTNHGQIATISTFGIVVAVIYSLLIR